MTKDINEMYREQVIGQAMITMPRQKYESTIREYQRREKIAREALDKIASWKEGKTVGSHFDEPGSAETAREALEQLGKEEV